MSIKYLQLLPLLWLFWITHSGAELGPFESLHVHLPEYLYYGKPAHILLTVQSLGLRKFQLILSSPNYIISNILINPQNSHDQQLWQKTDNLRTTCEHYKLKVAESVNYKVAYYKLIEVTYWIKGHNELVAKLTDVDMPERNAKRTHDVYVKLPLQKDCVIQLKFRDCLNFDKPRILDPARENYLTAYHKRNCKVIPALLYAWHLYEIPEEAPFAELDTTTKPTLVIPKYYLSLPPIDKRKNKSEPTLYVLQVHAYIPKKAALVYVARCYVHFAQRPVEAIIAGGMLRNSSGLQALMFSGKESRNYARATNQKQFLSYNWDCSAINIDDQNTQHCHKRMSTADWLQLPPKSLKIGAKYKFTLTVNSILNPSLSANMSQLVEIVSLPTLYVSLICQWNCAKNQYTPNEPLFIEVECLNCNPKSKLRYKWVFNGRLLEAHKSRVLRVTLNPEDDRIELAVLVTSHEGKTGQAKLMLRRNFGPMSGQCHIVPRSGTVWKTIFNVSCVGFVSEHQPLEYRYRANDLLLHRQLGYAEYQLRLPETDTIVIQICDSLYVCLSIELPVQLTSVTIPTNFQARRDYLKNGITALHKLYSVGDWETAIALNYVILQRAQRRDDIGATVKDLLQQKIETVEQLDQLVEMSRTLLTKSLPLTDRKVRLITRVFHKITAAYRIISEKENVWEIYKETFYKISEKLMKFMAEFSKEAEVIPLPECTMETTGLLGGVHVAVHDPYESMPDFDLKFIERIGVWLEANWNLDKWIYYLGKAASSLKTAADAPLTIYHDGIEMKLKIFKGEPTNTQKVVMSDGQNRVVLSTEILEYLRYRFQADAVAVQAWLLAENRYWWYPDCEVLSTRILAVNAYAGRAALKHDALLDEPIDIHLQLTQPSQRKQNTKKYQRLSDKNYKNFIIHNNGEFDHVRNIEIFTMIMPGNSQIAIHFIELKLDIDVLVTFRNRPSIKELKHKTCSVSPKKKTTLLVQNGCGSERIYIALFAGRHEDIANVNSSFRFTIQVRECKSWVYKRTDPGWSKEYCKPAFVKTLDKTIHCRCRYLSAYSGTIYYMIAHRLVFDPREDKTSFLPLIYLYGFLILCLLLLLNKKGRKDLVTDFIPAKPCYDGNIVMQINTGGIANSGTTANVTLSFVSFPPGEREVTIIQDPFAPRLTTNSTVTMRFNNFDICLPALLVISHDGSGMLPDWYVRSIVLTDLKNNDKQTFRIESWIKKNKYYATRTDFNKSKKLRPVYRGWSLFRLYFDQYFVNWFLLQPLLGPWRFGNIKYSLTRYQRICVWICKFSIIVCITFSWLGQTIVERYLSDRDLDLDLYKIAILIWISFVCGLIVDWYFVYFAVFVTE